MTELSPPANQLLDVLSAATRAQLGDIRKRMGWSSAEAADAVTQLEAAGLVARIGRPPQDSDYIELITLGFMLAG